MQTARRRRTTWAVAASALAHVFVLIVALLQRPTLPLPADDATGPPQPIIPILLLPRTPPAAAAASTSRPSAVRLHQRRLRPDDSPLPVAPLPAQPAPVPTAEAHPSPPAAAPATSAAEGPPAPDLRLALRHGLAGCANGGASLSRAERERCEEQLGRGVGSAPFMPAAIPARIRAYYDAVAEAKKPDPPPTPQRAPGSLGRFDIDGRATNGHGPGVVCHVVFGAGAKPKAPPHALTLGPCFIEPPKGSLTPEVDVAPP